MCVSYVPPSSERLKALNTSAPAQAEWPDVVWQDYVAPIIRRGSQGDRETILATYGMVPKRRIPTGVKKFATMNARSDTVGTLRSYSSAWRNSQLCLVPLERFFEPNWETGSHVRWSIGMADKSVFAVAGLWRSWQEEGGQESHSFTQLTINADDHPLMKRFHKPGEEKRSLVILPAQEYDAWLDCKDPEVARSFLNEFPAELMIAMPEPTPRKNQTAPDLKGAIGSGLSGDLF